VTRGVAGRTGLAYSFPGNSTAYVSVPDKASLDGFTTVSVDAWIYRTSASGAQMIASHGDGMAGDPYGFGILSNQLLTLLGNYPTCTGGATYQSTATLGINQWIHVAMTLDPPSGVLKHYINGVVQPSITPVPSGICPAAMQSLYIGAISTSGSWEFPGTIDEVHIFNVVLTDAQVCSLAGKTWVSPNCT
jgi:hypothetical protein